MGALDSVAAIGLLAVGAFLFIPKILDQRTPEEKAADKAKADADKAKAEDEGLLTTATRVFIGNDAVDSQQEFLDNIFGTHENPKKEIYVRQNIESQVQGPLPNFKFTSPIKVDSKGRISSDTSPTFSLPDEEKTKLIEERRKANPYYNSKTLSKSDTYELVTASINAKKANQIKKSIAIPEFSGTLAHITESRKGFSNVSGDIKYG